ncbi:hypothetical protein KR074_004592, partial [Drosophila pseudoananassae]
MRTFLAFLVAIFINVICNTAIFVKLDPRSFENKPVIGSIIFHLTVIGKLWQLKPIPNHWKSAPPWGLVMLEILFALLVGEFALQLLWLPVENFLDDMVTSNISSIGVVSPASRRVGAEICTVTVALAFMVLVVRIT